MGKSKLSLSEAIKHCEEVAEAEEQKYKEWKGDYSHLKKIDSCLECAKEYRQLAEWLKELKKYRIAHWKLRDMDYEYDFNSMFGENPMYYGEKVWDLFGPMYGSVEYEVMQYEEVNADEDSD